MLRYMPGHSLLLLTHSIMTFDTEGKDGCSLMPCAWRPAVVSWLPDPLMVSSPFHKVSCLAFSCSGRPGWGWLRKSWVPGGYNQVQLWLSESEGPVSDCDTQLGSLLSATHTSSYSTLGGLVTTQSLSISKCKAGEHGVIKSSVEAQGWPLTITDYESTRTREVSWKRRKHSRWAPLP